MRKPRLVVEEGDLDPPEPRGKSLQTSAQRSRQLRSDDLHSTLRVRSNASERGDQLQPPLRPSTLHPITARFGSGACISSPLAKAEPLAAYLHRAHESFRLEIGPNGPQAPLIWWFVAERAQMAKIVKMSVERALLG